MRNIHRHRTCGSVRPGNADVKGFRRQDPAFLVKDHFQRFSCRYRSAFHVKSHVPDIILPLGFLKQHINGFFLIVFAVKGQAVTAVVNIRRHVGADFHLRGGHRRNFVRILNRQVRQIGSKGAVLIGGKTLNVITAGINQIGRAVFAAGGKIAGPGIICLVKGIFYHKKSIVTGLNRHIKRISRRRNRSCPGNAGAIIIPYAVNIHARRRQAA